MKEGWKMVKLGEVCKIKGGSTPIKSNKLYWENGTIPWFTVDDIREQGRIIKYTNKSITELAAQKLCVYPVDTILLCCTASVGEYAITKIETTSNQQFNGLMIKDKSILSPEYLFHLVSTLKDVLLKLSGKTTIDFVSVSKVSDIEIPLPPLEEQHRIVSILDASFEKIDALKKNAEENLKNAKALFQQVLAQELKPKEGWVEKKLGEICTIKGGKRLPKGESISVEPTPYKYIRVADFRDNGTVIVDDVLYINETTYKQISQYTISSKDVYISIAGTIGKTGIIPEELEGANLTENACKLVLGNMINKRFLYYNTLSQYFKEQIKKGTKITAQPKLALNRLSEIIIPFPTDIDQQRKIVRTLDTLSEKCRRLEQIAQQTIRECDALKQSILRQAFSGEL